MTNRPTVKAGEVLFDLLEQAQAIEEEHNYDPQPGSLARQELTDVEAELRGSWFDSPVATAHSIGDLMIGSAMEHLEALSKALDDKNLVLSVFTLARAGLEMSSRAWWILESSIDGRRRVGRGLTELLYGWRQVMKIGPPLADPDDLRTRTQRVVDGAVSKGFQLLSNQSPAAAPELGERRPTATEVARRALKTSTDPKTGEGLFRVYSAIAHATVPGLVTLFLTEGDADEYGRAIGRFSMDPLMSVSVLGFSILGFDTAFRERAQLNGWAEAKSFNGYRRQVATVMRSVRESIDELMKDER